MIDQLRLHVRRNTVDDAQQVQVARDHGVFRHTADRLPSFQGHLQTLAGKTNQAIVRDFKAVAVKGNLKIELVPAAGEYSVEQAPVINFVEVVRED